MFYIPFKKYELSTHMFLDLKKILSKKIDFNKEDLVEFWGEDADEHTILPPFKYTEYIKSYCPDTFDIRYLDEVYALVKLVLDLYKKSRIDKYGYVMITYDDIGKIVNFYDGYATVSAVEFSKKKYSLGVECSRIEFLYYNDTDVDTYNDIKIIKFIEYKHCDELRIKIQTVGMEKENRYYELYFSNGPKLSKKYFKLHDVLMTYYRYTMRYIECKKSIDDIDLVINSTEGSYRESIDFANKILETTGAFDYLAKACSSVLSYAHLNGKFVN